MAKRKITPEDAGTRLLDLWSPGEGFGSPIGCVATTFTFDPAHFEEQCLARFLAMEASPDEGARAYLIEREEKLSQVFSCVLVDQCNARDQRSLRWNLLPVRVSGGIQHAKLTCLLWDKHLRLIVGSANLTEPAYRRNLETVASLDFDPEGSLPLLLAGQALDFLEELAALAPGSRESPGPKAALLQFISNARLHIQTWKDASIPAGQPRPALIGVLPGKGKDSSVLEQLSSLWRGPQPTSMVVVSPFFDQTPSAIDFTYDQLARLLTTRGPREITFRCAGSVLADGSTEVELPDGLFNPASQHRSMSHYLEIVDSRNTASEGGAHRPLHSKAYVLENEHLSLILIGSSNFTVKGLGLQGQGNVEMNLAYVIPSGNGAFRNQASQSLPKGLPVEPDEKVRFLLAGSTSDQEAEEVPLLPAGFDEALFDPSEGTGHLILRFIPEALPSQFEIATPQGTLVAASGSSAEHASEMRVPVAAPVSCLKVRWKDETQARQAADWIVNVTDASLLPPPSELASLNLEDLLAVLTSSRPAHWLLAERIQAREASGIEQHEPVVDPHKKVDTSQFLMRRMRRLSIALEGMRKRLELPVVSVEGLRWRLQGPFGPIALAKALAAESGAGAPFFILEIASTLQQIGWQASPSISPAARAALVSETLSSLKRFALEDSGESPVNLREYVATQLAELTP